MWRGLYIICMDCKMMNKLGAFLHSTQRRCFGRRIDGVGNVGMESGVGVLGLGCIVYCVN